MKIESIVKENTWLTGIARGWGNGYVLVSEGHPWYGVPYDDISCDVHYGLTFGQMVDKALIDHWPELSPEHEGMYMVGFDTCHYNDNQDNRSYEWLLYETESLKQQAIEQADALIKALNEGEGE